MEVLFIFGILGIVLALRVALKRFVPQGLRAILVCIALCVFFPYIFVPLFMVVGLVLVLAPKKSQLGK